MFILVTGGSASGKSAMAESLICKFGSGKRLYIATMEPIDSESVKRIERHHKLRAGKGFDTLEYYKRFEQIAIDSSYDAALLECMSNLLANEMYSPGGAGEDALMSISKGVDRLLSTCETVVIVTNEVFTDGVIFDASTAEYITNLGKINQVLAEKADIVIEAVYSIPVFLKGGKLCEGCI